MHFSSKTYVRAEAQHSKFGTFLAWHDPAMPHIRNGRSNATTRSARLCSPRSAFSQHRPQSANAARCQWTASVLPSVQVQTSPVDETGFS